MNLSLILACLWVVAAAILAAIPSRDNYWRRAYVLMAIGIPVLGFVTYQNGPWWGLLALAAGASILRYPLKHGLARLRGVKE